MSILFKSIKTFVVDLAEIFASDNHALALYERLINKTKYIHTEAIEKHITLFTEFIKNNKQNIIDRKLPLNGVLTYSQKVYINLNEIFSLKSDFDTKNTIWKHLAVLLCIIEPNSKELLPHSSDVKFSDTITGDSNEENFLSEIIKEVEGNVPKDMQNPQEGINNILQSGLISKLVNNMSSQMMNGKLDLNKLVESVGKLAGKMGEGDPEASAMTQSLLNNMKNMKM